MAIVKVWDVAIQIPITMEADGDADGLVTALEEVLEGRPDLLYHRVKFEILEEREHDDGD